MAMVVLDFLHRQLLIIEQMFEVNLQNQLIK